MLLELVPLLLPWVLFAALEVFVALLLVLLPVLEDELLLLAGEDEAVKLRQVSGVVEEPPEQFQPDSILQSGAHPSPEI